MSYTRIDPYWLFCLLSFDHYLTTAYALWYNKSRLITHLLTISLYISIETQFATLTQRWTLYLLYLNAIIVAVPLYVIILFLRTIDSLILALISLSKHNKCVDKSMFVIQLWQCDYFSYTVVCVCQTTLYSQWMFILL